MINNKNVKNDDYKNGWNGALQTLQDLLPDVKDCDQLPTDRINAYIKHLKNYLNN